MMTPVTGIVRMSLPLITFFGSLYGIDRIDNVVNIYTAEDVPFIGKYLYQPKPIIVLVARTENMCTATDDLL